MGYCQKVSCLFCSFVLGVRKKTARTTSRGPAGPARRTAGILERKVEEEEGKRGSKREEEGRTDGQTDIRRRTLHSFARTSVLASELGGTPGPFDVCRVQLKVFVLMLRRYFLGNTNLAWHGVLLVGKPFSKSRSARLEKIMEAEMMGVGSLSCG